MCSMFVLTEFEHYALCYVSPRLSLETEEKCRASVKRIAAMSSISTYVLLLHS